MAATLPAPSTWGLLRHRLGLDRARILSSGAAPVHPDLLRWFLPQLLLYPVGFLAIALLHAHRVFALPSEAGSGGGGGSGADGSTRPAPAARQRTSSPRRSADQSEEDGTAERGYPGALAGPGRPTPW